MRTLSFTPLHGIGEIQPGDDLAQKFCDALNRECIEPASSDVLVVAQKVVSKSEGRFVDLDTVQVSDRARALSTITRKDPRIVELALAESSQVLRAKADVLIVRHRLGFVMANAGIDRSNVPGPNRVLLLPKDPDESAGRLKQGIGGLLGKSPAIIVSDSFGRPWRKGVTNVALGAAGLPALIDRRGQADRNGRRLEMTEVAFADLVACAAGLVMGEGSEGIPAAIVRGLNWSAAAQGATSLLRPLSEDLFQ